MPTSKNRRIKLVITLAFLLVTVFLSLHNSSTIPPNTGTGQQPSKSKVSSGRSNVLESKAYGDLPDYVQHTIGYLQGADNNFARSETGYVGGREFTNFEKVLPTQSPGYYHEWDVHPKQNGVNRGTERLVSGRGGELYYTNTHYGDAGSPAFYAVNR